MNLNIRHLFAYVSVLVLFLSSSFQVEDNPIRPVMNKIIAGIYANDEVDRFKMISQQEVVSYIDPVSLQVLANEYLTFEVNTDVEIMVCRDIIQKEVPFWLQLNGFAKSNDYIKNENVNYEVWTKIFRKGKVNLGINGFDRHRYVYFVAIKPLNNKINLAIKPIWPLNQEIKPLDRGSVIYKDWDELVVSDYSAKFKDTYILSTSRGRSREAHLIDAFRFTAFPSSNNPDQILLSWKSDPASIKHISWRTKSEIKSCQLKYWAINSTDTTIKAANYEVIEDMLLANDPIVNRFNIELEGLQPNTTYGYQIIVEDNISPKYTFDTEKKGDSFEFGWFGDMHNDSRLQSLIPKWKKMYPNVSFYLQAGDLVNTGLYRDHWDQLFHATEPMTNSKPFMVIPGNHDSQEALFPSMYLGYFKFPENGPQNLPKGLSYHFDYKNTLFLMIDAVTLPTDEQKKWISETLANSKQKFKIVVFHFAPRTFESTYPDIIALWEPLFVKYGVDLVFNGHFHYYHRSKDDQKPKYIMSVATRVKGDNIQIKEGEHLVQQGYLYQHVKVDKDKLELTAVDSSGNIIDNFNIIKNK